MSNADSEVLRLKSLLRAVFEELDEGDGNAPGCGHAKPGVWDDDNDPEIAGNPCHWCAIWAQVRQIAAEVAYVRTDLLEAANARIAELERLNLSFATNEQELAQYRNEKNWTRPFDIDGKLMAEHALYLPKVMK